MTDPSPDATAPLPAIYLGHGAPPLLDDPAWMGELGAWAASMPRPKEILIVSAHWQTAPMAISATRRSRSSTTSTGSRSITTEMTYDAPGAPDLAAKVRGLMPANEPVLERETRGLDHGAWVPLKAMYPDADIPVLQMSMPDLDPEHLFEIGRRLAPLRDEGVLIVGSGFLTHGLPFIHEYFMGKPGAPQWSIDFDQWATEALDRGDVDTLFAFREKAPGMPYAHPTVEHFAPLFVTLGAVGQARRRARLRDRGLLLRALEALVRDALTGRAALSCGAGRAAGADPARTGAAGSSGAAPPDRAGG